MMTINKIQDDIVEEFDFFGDWMEKYEHIISFSKDLSGLSDDQKTSENLVKGCQSQVWLTAKEDGKNLLFDADSDAIITRGLVGLLVKVLSNHTPQEITNADLYFIDKIGLKEHLSPNRSNGLVSMVKKMKLYALAHSAKRAEE
jgi:cysteine desulfuration protein SufE